VFGAAALFTRADEFDTLRLRWRDMLTQGTNSSLGDPLYATWIDSVGSGARSLEHAQHQCSTRLWSA
jgi:hypothetical protein